MSRSRRARKRSKVLLAIVQNFLWVAFIPVTFILLGMIFFRCLSYALIRWDGDGGLFAVAAFLVIHIDSACFCRSAFMRGCCLGSVLMEKRIDEIPCDPVAAALQNRIRFAPTWRRARYWAERTGSVGSRAFRSFRWQIAIRERPLGDSGLRRRLPRESGWENRSGPGRTGQILPVCTGLARAVHGEGAKIAQLRHAGTCRSEIRPPQPFPAGRAAAA